MTPRILCFLGLVVFPVAVLGCGADAPQEESVARPVKTLRVGAARGGTALEFPGEVAPAQNAEMAFEVAGRIVEFPVDESQRVEEGELLAKLDPRDFQSALDSEQARLNVARADFERAKVLFEKDVLSRQNFDKAQRNFEMAEASFKTVEKSLQDSELRAPFAGIVAKKLVEDFQNINAKQPVLILQDDQTLEIDVDIPEVDFAGMEPGLSIEERNARARVEVTISSLPDRKFPGRIQEFSTTADSVTRTFAATFSFDPPEDVLIRPGMTANVKISVREDAPESRAALSIPANAVRSDDSGESFVWVLDPETMQVKRQVVTLGNYGGSLVQIQSGLERGSEIATSGVHHLRDGMTVRRYTN